MDLYNNSDVVESLAPAARTATANGTGADLAGAHGAVAVIHAGNWTDGTHTFEVQESDDNSAYTAVAAADLQGSEPAVTSDANDDQVYRVGYQGSKRYLRVIVTVGGSPATGLVAGAVILRGGFRKG